MVVVFGNQKGGAGKSTLAMLFATYITLLKKRKAVVLDMDYQRTILARYQEAKNLDHPELYEVLEVQLEDFPSIHHVLVEDNGIIIIDLPGRIDDEKLLPIIQAADVFIIPFAYDKATYQSTALFTLITEELNPDSKKFFVPNNIKGSARYSLASAINSDFGKYGEISPPIYNRVDFQRLTVLDIPVHLLSMVGEVFDGILRSIDND